MLEVSKKRRMQKQEEGPNINNDKERTGSVL